MFRDDATRDQDDAAFFAPRPHLRYRLTRQANAGPGARADGTIYLRLARFAWCRDAAGNRYTAAIVHAVAAHDVGALNRMSDADLDATWRSWLAEGAEVEVGPSMPAAGSAYRRGLTWFDKE